MSSLANEVQSLMDESETDGNSLTAQNVIDAARDKERFPRLNEHLWQVEEAELAMEARLARAHRLLISIKVTTEAGVSTRLFVHTRGVDGYQSLKKVAGNPDLASVKLGQLTADIARARARLRAFRAALPDETSDEIDEALETAQRRAEAAAAARQQPEMADAAA